MRILLSTTSFQDTPGRHHDVLASSGFEVIRARGPLTEAQLLDSIHSSDGFDGLLCGDDHVTARVIDAALPRLRVISKYGIGLDSIDLAHATAQRLPVLFTPGVNETTVAEHAFGLMIALAKHLYPHVRATKAGRWERRTGTELFGKALGVIGLGRVGREVVKRAGAFGMTCIGFGNHWDDAFARQFKLARFETPQQVLSRADVVTLHTHLTPRTRGMIDRESIALMKRGALLINTARGALLINTARGALVIEQDVADACRTGQLAGYATDVLELEPIRPPHVFQELDNVIVTPHVGSRTSESVQHQGLRAAMNLVNFLKGDRDFIQANAC